MLIQGRQIDGVIFDIDGTLVDSFATLVEVFNQGIRQFSLAPVSLAFLNDGMKRNLTLGEILQKVFPPETEGFVIERCRDQILEHYLRIEETEVKPFPAVPELFRNLKARGLRVGVATGRTSAPEREWVRFKRYGLDPYIDSIVTSKEVEHRKPAPDALIECARRLGIAIENCLVVGDTESDIVAARRAGAISVAVTTGLESRALLEQEKPEFLFESLDDFKRILDEKDPDNNVAAA